MTSAAPPLPRSATATACGKLILLGEHAVVYGVPAIAAGIDRGARARATLLDPATASASTLDLGGRTLTPAASDDLARAFAALLGDDAPLVAVSATSDLLPGGGLGSSAALGVAIARAIEALAGSAHDTRALAEPAPTTTIEDRVMARALAWERVFHGNPSGIDSYAAAHGGTFRFIRGQPAQPLHLGADLHLCVGLSGAGASTRTMVEGLARLFDRKPDLQRRSIDAITSLVANAALALEAGDLAALGKLMDLNQMVLAGLFLSTEPLERLCHLARQHGALGAKLTGSGGGGAVLALVPPPESAAPSPADDLLQAWKSAGFDGFVTTIKAPSATPSGAPASG